MLSLCQEVALTGPAAPRTWLQPHPELSSVLRILFACGLVHQGYELPKAGKKESPLILTPQVD